MAREINLMQKYPRTKRDIKQRGSDKTEEDRALASKFEKDFFDGDRKNGYGGFDYDPRFWYPVIPDFQQQYNLDRNSSILDVGCAKGFMINDFSEIIPGIKVKGIDISKYAIENCIPSMKESVQVADARDLPFDDDSFDLVISITTVHNFERSECIQALKEIERVSKKNAFITVDAYRNNLEKEAMMAWNLTAKTILHTKEWELLFEEANYSSDYYWFMP